jgi:tetratricopeptide (TPR) repeat protein
MKSLLKKIVLSFIILGFSITPLAASSATSRTRTLNAKYEIVWTQDAYLPKRTLTNLGLRSPQDSVFDSRDHLFIADKDNARIVEYDTNTDTVVQIITHPMMRTPTGVTLATNGDIYVADPAAAMVLRFSSTGELIETFERPTTASFGDTNFKPFKVAVDNRRNMYIVSEGVYNGVIQLSNAGEFLGYFTSNRVRLNLVQMLQDFFFTEAQKALLLGRVPTTFTNVYLDNKGIVYTTTMGTNMHGVKKHNTAGQNMFANQYTWGPSDLVDLTTDDKGIIYGASKSGLIFVYTNDGQYIFSFGSSYANYDIAGLFDSISSISVDSKGQLWVLDGEKSFLQSFEPTEYATQIYAAINLFNQGEYEQATVLWERVLRLNQMSVLAHNGIGMNYMYTEQYDEAMFHFKIAGNRFYYSQAFWEVRNKWLQANLGNVLFGGIILAFLLAITRKARRKSDWLRPVKNVLHKIASIKIVSEVLFMFAFLRHPIDSFYELKTNRKGSIKGALIILLLFFLIFIWYMLGKGFIYQIIAIEDVDLQSVIIGFFSIIFLAILCNYLVSSINDGEGSFTQLIKMVAYSLAPIMIFYVVIIGFSYVLTYNETFLLQTLQQGAILWTGVNLYIGIQEVHNYSVREAIRSIVLTIVFILIIALVLLIVIIMTEQVYMFFEAIIKEVIRNVTN